MEMLSNSSFVDNDDDSSLLPLFKTMQSKSNFEDDDYDDDKYDNSSEIAPLFLGSFLLFSRKSKWEHQHLSWFAHVEELQHENIFAQSYQTSFHAFKVLVEMLYENINHMTIQDMGSLPLRCQSGLKLLLKFDFVGLQGLHILI